MRPLSASQRIYRIALYTKPFKADTALSVGLKINVLLPIQVPEGEQGAQGDAEGAGCGQ